MARLISLYRDEGQCSLGRRELPVPIDENIAMVMKLPDLNLNRTTTCLKNTELDRFIEKCSTLNFNELCEALKVGCKDVFELIGQNVPCIGCRRSTERLYNQLVESSQEALYPVTMFPNGNLGLVSEVMSSTSMLFILLKFHGSRLNSMVESISAKSRHSRRCPLHSLDAHRARANGLQWKPLWNNMAQECREELTLVEADTLLDTMEAYLQKHRFCPECRLKVLRAYSLLVGEIDPAEEKGYKPLLYLGLKSCPQEKHIHVQCNTDLIAHLIARAEPELVGSSRRERHAKTMEVAQEEIVTCVGICLLERLQRVAQRLREEEQTVDMLQCASLQALRQSFELAVESKRGVSQLELLCEELSREEEAMKQRKEMKRLRRKKRRGKKDITTCEDFGNSNTDKQGEDTDREEEYDDDIELMQSLPCHCACSSDSNTKYNKFVFDKKVKTKSNNNNNDSTTQTKSNMCSNDPTWTVEGNRQPQDCCYFTHATNCSFPKHSKSTTQNKIQSSQQLTTKHVYKNPPDSGYSSTNSSTLTTPEGSDVACTEGLCNHYTGSPVQCRPSPSPVPEMEDIPDLFSTTSLTSEVCQCVQDSTFMNETRLPCPIHIKPRSNCCGTILSLQEMLEDWCVKADDDGDEESFIPAEEVQAFHSQQQHYNEKRRQLRHDLRMKFDQLCGRISNVNSRCDSVSGNNLRDLSRM